MDAIRSELEAKRYRSEWIEPADVQGKEYEFTDWGNALRLVDRHGRNIRHCPEFGTWLVWSGPRWERDREDRITMLAKETIRSMYAEAAQIGSDRQRKALLDHIRRTESTRSISAMVKLAQTEPGIVVLPEHLDTDPWLLTCLNGTLDLRTGKLLDHQRNHLITKLAPVAYDPDAKAPTWEKFLDRIFASNVELIRYDQRVTGYALTGDTREQVLFFDYGKGANGKTTKMNTTMAMMGDHAKVTAPELLLASKRDAHPTALADLHGVRLVATVEVEEGKRLAEILVKQLTGGERVKARWMHKDFFEFTPTAKIFLIANHKPKVRGTDLAIWRRIRLIPFTVTIPEEEQDKALIEKLKGELPGILAWAVQGCLEWQRQGLGTPPEVTSATQQYRQEMDVLGAFIDERCLCSPEAKAQATALYKAYKQWSEDNGEPARSQKDFGMRLRERGFNGQKARGVSWWHGVGLVDDGG